METHEASGRPLVHTSCGAVSGVEKEGCFVFRGVPFAAKPRRFHRPSPLQPWQGVRNCQRSGKSAVQPSIASAADIGKLSIQFALRSIGLSKGAQIPQLLSKVSTGVSEDCLFLNIASPSLQGRAPVLCFIHGGAFILGSGSQMLYQGCELARREGVLVVSINYRLGCLGFLNVPGGEPNCGIWDQIEALRWIQSEIQNFGGDPDRVTICGESAGGMSCGVLLTCPVAQPLFHRAILMSGAFSNVISSDDADSVSEQFCKLVGVDADAKLLEQIDLERLLAAQIKLFARSGVMPFQPCIDGELIVDFPMRSLQTGSFPSLANKQVIVGSTAQEWNLFSPPFLRSKQSLAVTTKRIASQLGPSHLASFTDISQLEIAEPEIRNMLKTLRADRTLSGWSEVHAHLATMLIFQGPAHLAAECLSSVAERVYVYSFDFDAGRFGAAHGSELPLLFGTQNKNWFLRDMSGARRDSTIADAVSNSLMSRFAAFSRSGVPDISDPSRSESKVCWPHCPPGSISGIFSFNRECKVVQNVESPAMRQIIEYLRRARRPFGVKVKYDLDAVPQARL